MFPRPENGMIWVLASCRSMTLTEVPITGGTELTRDAVRDAVNAFDAAVGPGRVELHEIRVDVESDEVWGTYTHGTRTVTITEDASLGRTVRHELCHALVAQEDLAGEPIDRVVELLFDPEYPHSLADLPGHSFSASEQWSEAVATICEQGPYWAADTLENDCLRIESFEDDPDLTDAVAAWMVDRVWTAFSLPEPLVLDPDDTIGVDLSMLGLDIIAPTTDPTIVVLTYQSGETQHVDLYDGTPVVSDLAAAEIDEPLPAGLGTWSPPSLVAGWAGGPAVVVGNWIPLPLAIGTTTRVLAHDGEQWRFVGNGCSISSHWAFTADDGVWLASSDGGSFGWTELAHR